MENISSHVSKTSKTRAQRSICSHSDCQPGTVQIFATKGLHYRSEKKKEFIFRKAISSENPKYS